MPRLFSLPLDCLDRLRVSLTTPAEMRLLTTSLGIGSLMGLLVAAAWAYTSGHYNHRATESERPAMDVRDNDLAGLRDVPLNLGPLSRRLIAVSSAEVEWFNEQIAPPADGRVTASYCYHLLLVHGLEARFDHDVLSSSAAILKLLTDDQAGKAYFGESPIRTTPTGVRFVTGNRDFNLVGPALEAHRDQCLAVLADIGIPLSFQLSVENRTYPLRDALRDSIANFHLGQDELAWTSIAYAAYLSPVNHWVNRFGERFSFDDLVEELLDRPLNTASCGGAHVLMALAKLYRADTEQSVLTPTTRERLASYLRDCAFRAVSAQERDGSWSVDWCEALGSAPSEAAGSDNFTSRLLVTGHLAEWMLYLPTELFDSPATGRKAGLWLMDAVRNSTVKDRQSQFCPFSHAVKVLGSITFLTEELAER